MNATSIRRARPPSCRPTHQHDVLAGGEGRDHIYAGHGFNRIEGGDRRDLVLARFERGRVDREAIDYRPGRLRR